MCAVVGDLRTFSVIDGYTLCVSIPSKICLPILMYFYAQRFTSFLTVLPRVKTIYTSAMLINPGDRHSSCAFPDTSIVHLWPSFVLCVPGHFNCTPIWPSFVLCVPGHFNCTCMSRSKPRKQTWTKSCCVSHRFCLIFKDILLMQF